MFEDDRPHNIRGLDEEETVRQVVTLKKNKKITCFALRCQKKREKKANHRFLRATRE